MRRAGLIAAALLGGVLAGGSSASAARIVYVVDDDEISTTLSSVLPNGKGDREVTSTSAYDDQPAWGPSHNRVAFTRGNRIWIVRADGTRSHAVPHTRGGDNPAWSPDARTLVFSIRRHKALAVFTIRTDGRRRHRLTRWIPDPHHNRFGLHPVYSPGGRSIAYDGARGVMRMRANGHRKHLLVRGATNADWAPKARRIAFERNGGIFVARASGHGVHVLRRDSGGDLIYDDPAWSPNGRRIAYSLYDETDVDTDASVHTIRPDAKRDRYVVSGYAPDW